MKSYDILKKAVLSTLGQEETNQHRMVGERGFAQDVVQLFFKEYHMHSFPNHCTQELRLEFENIEGEGKNIVLGIASDGYLTLREA